MESAVSSPGAAFQSPGPEGSSQELRGRAEEARTGECGDFPRAPVCQALGMPDGVLMLGGLQRGGGGRHGTNLHR